VANRKISTAFDSTRASPYELPEISGSS